jgi:polysaccharide biosynthesis protein PelD
MTRQSDTARKKPGSRWIALQWLLRNLFQHKNAGASSFAAGAWALFEMLVFCFGTLVIGNWASPGDPFGVHQQFPWLWIIPAILAMRYGTGIGASTVVFLVVSWIAMWKTGMMPALELTDFPKSYFLGGLILVLVCSQFSDVWNARSRRLRATNAYLDERLNTLTKNHFLLRLSHERLEQDLLAKPLTLRETLMRLRTLTSQTARNEADPLPGAGEFLQLLGQSCQLEVAAVHSFDLDGIPQAEPSASLGRCGALDANDPLYLHAMMENLLAHVQIGSMAESIRDSSRYLICAPLQPSKGAAVGILVVEKLPFFALNEDALQLLSVLIGYYADGIQMNSLTLEILQRLPSCPQEMALELVRLSRIQRSAGIDSSIVALVFENNEDALDMLEQIKRLKRGVDLSWELSGPAHRALITLLPLAGSAAVEGYLLRLELALHGQFGSAFSSSRVATHIVHLGLASPVEAMAGLVERCAI